MKALRAFLRWLAGPPRAPNNTNRPVGNEKQSARPPRRRGFVFAQYQGVGDPPAGYWKACHPSTAVRFKAEVTCPLGHGMTLKGHSISSTGIVRPSIVCPKPGCSFHEFAALDGWNGGELR